MNDQNLTQIIDFYQAAYSPEETTALITHPPADQLDHELTAVRIAIRRTLLKMDTELDTTEFVKLARIVLYGARTIAYLSRTKRTLSGTAADDLLASIATITEELAIENDWKLFQ